METVEYPEHPDRCKAPTQYGQCRYYKLPTSEYCSVHTHGSSNTQKEDVAMYQLTDAKYKLRMSQLKESPEIKSLREEIALTRVIIEKRFNMIKTDTDLLSASTTLNTLFLTVDKLIKTAHSMEQSMNILLSKDAVKTLGDELTAVLIEELKDVPGFEDIVDTITERVLLCIEKAAN